MVPFFCNSLYGEQIIIFVGKFLDNMYLIKKLWCHLCGTSFSCPTFITNTFSINFGAVFSTVGKAMYISRYSPRVCFTVAFYFIWGESISYHSCTTCITYLIAFWTKIFIGTSKLSAHTKSVDL